MATERDIAEMWMQQMIDESGVRGFYITSSDKDVTIVGPRGDVTQISPYLDGRWQLYLDGRWALFAPGDPDQLADAEDKLRRHLVAMQMKELE